MECDKKIALVVRVLKFVASEFLLSLFFFRVYNILSSLLANDVARNIRLKRPFFYTIHGTRFL